MRKARWKTIRPSSLSEALELCVDYSSENRKPVKVLADLMGVETKTLYRWVADNAMPLNRLRQFETFCGVSFVSEYLAAAHGDKIVVPIPVGKKSDVTDLASVQANFSEAMMLLSRFYQNGESLEATVEAITRTLAQLAFQRSNVMKAGSPELDLFAGDQ
ncbi:hypothetical protein B0920_02220 [Massilia sp. KIM]|nr:hypothetical protein B0920_02220 [Massilia sp. KIM]